MSTTEHAHQAGPRTYLVIGAFLVLLTVMEVAVFYIPALARVLVPVLLLLAGEDRIVDNDGVRELMDRLMEARLEVEVYPGADHSVQFERTGEVARRILRFVVEVERDAESTKCGAPGGGAPLPFQLPPQPR